MNRTEIRRSRKLCSFAVVMLALAVCTAADAVAEWWDVTPEPETPSPYYDSLLYSEIAPMLREFELNSDRVQVRVLGRSAGDRNLFLAVVADDTDPAVLEDYKALRRLMTSDPGAALAAIEASDGFKVPVLVNCSIHGNEYTGTDACMRMIGTLAYDDSEAVLDIMDNAIVLFNVVHNPDGRVMGSRRNAAGFDINRDMITQSQPESRALARVVADWNPMVTLDLHGFVNPMLIEPCTPPHNPNYEYDLYLGWALQTAYAMRDELFDQTDETDVIIPFLEWDFGWDDWAPIYAAMYPMLHGSYGHTLETPHRDERGVSAHYATVWGMLQFVAANKEDMVRDQIEVYRRGMLDLPQVLIPAHLLAETVYDQFNDLTIQDFPQAYIIPAQAPLQENAVQAAQLVQFLLENGVQVEAAGSGFSFDGVLYPRGTYVVWMDQPKRTVANTILEDGLDVSAIEGLTFYSPPAAWSHPLLWGVTRRAAAGDLTAATIPVTRAAPPRGSMGRGLPRAYAFVLNTLPAFRAVNELMAMGHPFYRARHAFSDGGRTFRAGTVVMPPDRLLAYRLMRQYYLDISVLSGYPDDLVVLKKQHIAVYGNDEGLRHCLKELGFDFDEVGAGELNAGPDLSAYDLFITVDTSSPLMGLTETGRESVRQFSLDGGDFIGIGYGAAGFAAAVPPAGGPALIDLTTAMNSGNGIVAIDLETDSAMTAGFGDRGHAFVYRPTWFTALGAGVQSAVGLASDNMLVAGFWPGWPDSPAAGQSVMAYADAGERDTCVIGFDPSFRGHPRNTFKLVGNAVFSGLDDLFTP